jgi:type I restriction enzyme M protein
VNQRLQWRVTRAKTTAEIEVLRMEIAKLQREASPEGDRKSVEVPAIRHGNTLARPLRDYGPKDQVDVIVTNPPFGGMEEDGIEGNFPTEFRTRETADLFLVLVMELLKDGGRAAIVLPDGTLFGEGIKTRIKRKLLEECNLHTIVRLPKGVFAPYTTIKTNILFFTKGEPTKDVWFYEHPYPEGAKSYSKTKPMRIEEFQPEKAWWVNREETESAWKVTADDIAAGGFNLDIDNPAHVDLAHEDPDVLLARFVETTAEVEAAREALRSALAEALLRD